MNRELFVKILKENGINFSYDLCINEAYNTFGSNKSNLYTTMNLTIDNNFLSDIENPDSYIKNRLKRLFDNKDIEERFYNSCLVCSENGKYQALYCCRTDFKDDNMDKWIKELSVREPNGLTEHLDKYKDNLHNINYALDALNKYENSSFNISYKEEDDKFISTLTISGYMLSFLISSINDKISTSICDVYIKNQKIDDIIEKIYTSIVGRF